MNWLIAKLKAGRRFIRKCLYGVAGLAVLIALFYGEENWRGKRAWEQFKQQWEAKGERFDWASVIPPPVPDSQNFALAPIVVSSYAAYMDKNGHAIRPMNTNVINRLRMSVLRSNDWFGNYWDMPRRSKLTTFGEWQIAKWTDLNRWQYYFRTPSAKKAGSIGIHGDRYRIPSLIVQQPKLPIQQPKPTIQQPPPTNEFPVAPQPQTPAADVLLALSRYDAAIAALRQASQLPYSRFPLNYEHPEERLYAHGSLSCALVLQLRSVAELSLNQTDEALEDIKLALRLAESFRSEPFFTSQRHRIDIVSSTLQPIWEGLAAHRWSDSQLVALESELSKLDFISDYATTVRGERALASYEMDNLRKTHNARITPEYNCEGDVPLGERLFVFYFHSFPSGWYYQNQFRACRIYTEELLPLLDAKTRTISQVLVTNTMYNGQPIPYGADKTDRMDWPTMRPWEHPFWHPYSILDAFADRGSSASQYAYAQGTADLARVACALERYRLWRNQYPELLDALVPRFLDKLPHDVINGQPLHYRLIDNGQFVLYSVGWANRDEHGKVRQSHDPFADDVRNGNWVWRYPQPALRCIERATKGSAKLSSSFYP